MQHIFLLGELDPDKTLYDAFTTNTPPSSGLRCGNKPELEIIVELNEPIFLPLNAMGVLRLNSMAAGTSLENNYLRGN